MFWSHRVISSLAVVALVAALFGCGPEEVIDNDGNGNQQNGTNQDGNDQNGEDDDWDLGFVEVSEVIQQSCALSGCHGEPTGDNTQLGFGANQDDLSLESIQSVFESYEVGGRALVEPGDADESELYLVLVSDDPDVLMPQGGSGLPDAQIESVRSWIDDGAVYE